MKFQHGHCEWGRYIQVGHSAFVSLHRCNIWLCLKIGPTRPNKTQPTRTKIQPGPPGTDHD